MCARTHAHTHANTHTQNNVYMQKNSKKISSQNKNLETMHAMKLYQIKDSVVDTGTNF